MSGYNDFMVNPWTQMGLGILAANRPGASTGQAIGQGLLGGMSNMQKLEDWQQRQQERKQREEAQAALAQQFPQLAPFTNAFGAEGVNAYATMNPAPKAPTTTGGMQWNAATGQWEPIPGWRPGVSVNVGDQLRNIGDEVTLETIKGDQKYYFDQAVGADQAIDMARKGINLMRQGQTGRWEPVMGSAAAWAGIAPEAARNYDMWRDYATEQALGTLQQFKGPTTDFEFGVAKSLAVQQGKEDFANFAALKAQERAALRSRAKRSAYSQWVKKGLWKSEEDFETWFEREKNPLPAWDIEQFQREYERFRGGRNVQTSDDRARKQGWVVE